MESIMVSAGVFGRAEYLKPKTQSYCTSAASIQNFGGYIGGTVSPIATGIAVDVTGSFVIALAIGAAITILGAGILQLLVRTQISAGELEGSIAAVPAE